jgi:oligopeptide/dipeptide ABC transporter ATP-binding protein
MNQPEETANGMNSAEPTLLEGFGLRKYYPVKGKRFGSKLVATALDGVDIVVRKNRNLAIVGESGCGKTTLGRMMAGIVEPSEGVIKINGKPIELMSRKEMARYIQPIFQDPYSSLNPLKTVYQTISKLLKTHGMAHDAVTISNLLDEVGLSPGKNFLDRYPHELSGGQRQRVTIARALSIKPQVIVADEPFTGLDPTLQSQILKLMRELQSKHKLTYVLISHDLSAVKSLCDEAIVVYLGKVVESGSVKDLLERPAHPYTLSLLKSYPSGNPNERSWIDDPPIMGDIPSSVEIPAGCRFHPRCRYAEDSCRKQIPSLLDFGGGHYAACPIVWNKMKDGADPSSFQT